MRYVDFQIHLIKILAHLTGAKAVKNNREFSRFIRTEKAKLHLRMPFDVMARLTEKHQIKPANESVLAEKQAERLPLNLNELLHSQDRHEEESKRFNPFKGDGKQLLVMFARCTSLLDRYSGDTNTCFAQTDLRLVVSELRGLYRAAEMSVPSDLILPPKSQREEENY